MFIIDTIERWALRRRADNSRHFEVQIGDSWKLSNVNWDQIIRTDNKDSKVQRYFYKQIQTILQEHREDSIRIKTVRFGALQTTDLEILPTDPDKETS